MSTPPPQVLSVFAPPVSHWSPVGGGLSGALVFAGADSAGPLVALKGYPPGTPVERVRLVHERMRAAARLPFVPRLLPTRTGTTAVEAAGRVWELAAWVPGQPLTAVPTHVSAAGAAVAGLHHCWRSDAAVAPFPAVERRLGVLRDWRRSPPARPTDPRLAELVREASARLPTLAADAERQLTPLAGQLVPVQPVLGDVHPAHVLFTGDTVTGVIDFAATRFDHPAADLARLAAELPADALDHLLDGYSDPTIPPELVRTLADAGRVGSIAGWLLRLAADPTAGGYPAAVADRLRVLLGGR